MKLLRDAVPTLFSCRQDPIQERVIEMDVLSSTNTGESFVTNSPVPSCSGMQMRTPIAGCRSLFTDQEGEPVQSSSGMQQRATASRRSLFRGIQGVSRISVTPRKKRLMNLVKTKEAHIRNLKRICKKKRNDIKALTNIEENPAVRNIFDGMTNSTASFLISQLRCARRKPHGRRWTTEEKVIALAVLKKSPRCYNLLRRLIALPSKNTLLAMLQKIPFHSGINEHLFQHIAKCISKDEDKYCALLFDEMDIKEHLQYDCQADRIIGFEELDGSGESKKLANKALVFMLQGLVRNWKQPIAYYFSNGACPAGSLKVCIESVLKACHQVAKVDVVATICDMGSTNVRTLKEMGSSMENPCIIIGTKKIFTMFDPPHLLKCTYSLFRKHNMLLSIDVAGESQQMEARFGDVVKAHKIDQSTPLVFRALHKVKAFHLVPQMKYAMKVNIAAQMMSHTVAAFLYTLLSRGELEQRTLATATFVKQVDELFDSFNGSKISPPDGKAVKCCITENSAHHEYWRKAFNIIRQWHFQRYTTTRKLRTNKPPSQTGWLTTINAIQGIWAYLHSRGVKSLRPRSLNQDPLENLFGGIRGGCGSGDNPTAAQFSGSLKTQILNGLTHQKIIGSNCEEDEHQLLSNLTEFLVISDQAEEEVIPTMTHLEQSQILNDNVADEIAKAVAVGATATLSVAYVSGFVAKKIFENLDCVACRSQMLSSSKDPHNLFISFKEWAEEEHLQYPSEALVVAIGHAVTVLERTLEDHCTKPSISVVVSEAISENVNFSALSCNEHENTVTKNIIRAVWKIGLPWWCKRKNQLNLQTRKDTRSKKRKVKKFQHV